MKTILSRAATPEMAKAWLIQIVMDVGPGFHPDTDAEDYIDVATGEPLFSKKQAQEINESMDTVFKLLPDPYEIGLPVALNMLEE